VPNVRSTSISTIAEAYGEHDMPPAVWDFTQEGYELVGGRLDQLPDGRPVAYTFYRSASDAIMCAFETEPIRAATASNAVDWYALHQVYSYRGYSICFIRLMLPGHFVALLVSRVPPQQLADIVTRAEY